MHKEGAQSLQEVRVVIVLHYYATGPGQELHGWLVGKRIAEAALLEHPFPYSDRSFARWERCSPDGKLAGQNFPRWVRPMFLRYTLDFIRTLRLVLRAGVRYDYYVGNGAFNTAPGIILRWLGKVHHVVLYTIDYAPQAGGNRLYEMAYRWIDRFCCRRADVIWNLSPRMQEARQRDGLQVRFCAPVVIVPHGTHATALACLLPGNPDPLRVAFMGHVQEKSGLQLFLEVMPELAQELPGLRLEVFGDGPYLPRLREQVIMRGLTSSVAFHGFIPDHVELERQLARCGVGLALYHPETAGFSWLADPGKPKVYLACGLPVIITNVPSVAEEIERRKAGISIRFDVAELRMALHAAICNHGMYRANALAMAKEFNWDCVFDRAWQETQALVKREQER